MKHFIISGVLLLIFSSFNLNAQVTQQWVQRYNGTGNYADLANAIAVDGSGNVYVTGQSYGPAAYDYVTIKYNTAGVPEWTQRYNGTNDSIDIAVSIAVDAFWNVYVTGYSAGVGTKSDIVTIKYNSGGVMQWNARFNGTGNKDDKANTVAVDASGNVYVSGWTTGAGSAADYITIKYNSSGIQQWVSFFSGGGNINADYGNSMTIDNSGGVYVTGQSSPGATPHYATLKYNSSGVQQWFNTFTSSGGEWNTATYINIDNSGNTYVTGWSWGCFGTVKYNSLGAEQWSDRYSFGNGAHGTSVAADISGNVYVTGVNISSAAILKYNSSGVFQWDQSFPGSISALKVDVLGNAYITGRNSVNISTIRYNPLGIQDWSAAYNGANNNSYELGMAIALDQLNNVYITGYSDEGATNYDYVTIKYSQTVGIQPVSGEIPVKYSLSQNYPNPFNPSTKIRFSIPPYKGGKGDVSLRVYDILGRKVSTLVNEQLSPGTYEVDWNASNFPSGVYYYKLTAGEFSEAKKMILIK